MQLLRDSTDEAIDRFHSLNGLGEWGLRIFVYPAPNIVSDKEQEIALANTHKNPHHYIYHVTISPTWSSSPRGISCRRDCLADAINEICDYVEQFTPDPADFDYQDLT